MFTIFNIGAKQFVLVCLVLMFSSCSHELPVTPDTTKNLLENGNFEAGNFSFWGIEAARENSIEITTNPVCVGNYAAKLTLYPADYVNMGHRVELTRLDVAAYGQERVYSWCFMISNDYIDDNRLQIIHQFHDWPNFANGEDWDDHPGYAPPIYTRFRNDTCYVITHTLATGYKTLGQYKITKGEWFKIRYQAKWSMEEDGYVMVHFNGHPVTPFNGIDYKYYMPTVYNKMGNYLKIGLYTDAAIQTQNTVYVDEVSVEPVISH